MCCLLAAAAWRTGWAQHATCSVQCKQRAVQAACPSALCIANPHPYRHPATCMRTHKHAGQLQHGDMNHRKRGAFGSRSQKTISSSTPLHSNPRNMLPIHCAVVALLFTAVLAYDNEAPNSLLPPLGWSSWVALGPGAEHPVFDYCDEFRYFWYQVAVLFWVSCGFSVKAAADAFVEVGLYDAGYRHFHLDDCWAGGRNETGFLCAAILNHETQHKPKSLHPLPPLPLSNPGFLFAALWCFGTAKL